MVDIKTDDDDVNATAEIVLEDFEVFDIRDVMNLVAYSAMSSGGCTANDFAENIHLSPRHPTFSFSNSFYYVHHHYFLI